MGAVTGHGGSVAGEGVVVLPMALVSAALIGGDPTNLALEVRNDIQGWGDAKSENVCHSSLRT